MAGVNATNVGTTFVHILDGATETLNQSSKARSRVTQDYEWRGSHIEHKLHTARNPAVGAMNDGGVFPVPDKEDYASIKIGRKIVGGSLQLSDVVMATASKSPEVAVDVVSSHTEGLMKNILKWENYNFFRDGTGLCGTVSSAVAGGFGSSAADVKFLVDDARGFWDKAEFDVYASDASTYKGRLKVTTVNEAPHSSGYFQVNCNALGFTLAVGDLIYWKDSKGITMSGLDALIDNSTGSFQGLTISSCPRYTSMVLSNASTLRDLDPSLFRQLQAGIYQKTGNDLPVSGLTCLGTAWQLQVMDELYESALRLSPDSKTTGVATASFQSSLGRVTLEPDSDAPFNKLFLVDFSQLYRGVQKKLGWRMEGGQILKRSDTAGVWTATAIEIAEMYIKGRNSSGKIKDLTETVKIAY
jgi:hypothetical protein